MRRKLLSLLLAISIIFTLCTLSFAAGGKNYIVDNAKLLSSYEAEQLQAKLSAISSVQNFDVVVVTVNTTGGKTAEAYADDYFDYNGYGQGENKDGCLLLVDMGDRAWHISTTGYGITAITNSGIEELGNDIEPLMKDGEWYEAFTKYSDTVDGYVTQAKNGTPYEVKDNNLVFGILVCLVASVIISLIIVINIRNSYKKAVRFKANATDYLVPGSFNLTGAYDRYLYSNTVRTKIERQNSSVSSTHVGSSGTSHGGGGGHF